MVHELRQGLRAEMQLSPRLLQAVEILALPAGDLEAYLLEAYQANEALAIDESAWVARRPAPPRAAGEGDDAWLESRPGRGAGLVERALEQLALRPIPADLAPWVELVVHALDAQGYLSTPDAALLALARERGLAGGAAELGRAIALVQGLEPRGIGGRNAIEALLLQLDPADPDYARLCALLEDFLEDVARNKLPAVARALGITLAELALLLERLRELELRPAAELAEEVAPPIAPDVVVHERGGTFEVAVESSGLPAMRVDPGVRALARDRGLAPDVRRRLRGRITEARWLLRAVEQRRETLQRVATAVFAHQEPFLRHGPARLRPLRMAEVADLLGLHVSTVSRAVAGKHAETPWGVLPLRGFFQSGVAGAADGAEGDVARDRVRDLVREIVAAEDAAAPLSDEGIAAALAARGHAVARRTVAQYRRELGIGSSYRRRRYA